MNCAWCEKATGELVVPGARGAFVHPSCEASRRGRRWFLGALGLGAAAVAAAPLLELVPEAPVIPDWLYGIPYHQTVNVAAIDALLKEKYRKVLPHLFERENTFYEKIRAASDPEQSSRQIRIPRSIGRADVLRYRAGD